jgi:hypothetical protein
LGARCSGRDPSARQRNYRRRWALGHDEFGRRPGIAEAVVVDIETPVEAKTRVQRETGDERRRSIARLFQHRRRGTGVRRQSVAAVVAQAMLKRVLAGENAGVRRQRDHRVRVGEVEPNALGRQAIERRRRGRAAVAAKRVGAKRIDGDEQDVLLGYGMEIGLRAAAAATCAEAD